MGQFGDNVVANAGGGHAAVRMILGGVLLVAAALKGYQLATGPTDETCLTTSRWFLIAVVECEVFLGLCLISGLFARPTWLVTLGCFFLFACVSLHKALSVEVSCGCFGSVETNPWYTAGLDVAAVVALLRWRPSGLASMAPAPARRPSLHYFALGGSWLVIALSSGWGMSRFQPATMTHEGVLLGDSQFVILEPETWAGKRFPLFAHVDIGPQLAEGGWVVLLYHHDCPQCREVLPKYERLAQDCRNEAVALIEISPFIRHNDAGMTGVAVHGRLANTRDWFVQTPTEIRLNDGMVTAVRGPDSLDPDSGVSQEGISQSNSLVSSPTGDTSDHPTAGERTRVDEPETEPEGAVRQSDL